MKKTKILISAGLSTFLLASVYAADPVSNMNREGAFIHQTSRSNSDFAKHYVQNFPVEKKSVHKKDKDKEKHHPERKKPLVHHNFPKKQQRPVIVVDKRPIIVENRVVTVAATSGEDIPYGFLYNGMIRSPWSNFTISSWGRYSGQILCDPNTGQTFYVP